MRFQLLVLSNAFLAAKCVYSLPQTVDSSSSLNTRNVNLEPAPLPTRDIVQLASGCHPSLHEAHSFTEPEPEAFSGQNTSEFPLEKRVLTHVNHQNIHSAIQQSHLQTGNMLAAAGHPTLANKYYDAAAAHGGASNAHLAAELIGNVEEVTAAHTASKAALLSSMTADRALRNHH